VALLLLFSATRACLSLDTARQHPVCPLSSPPGVKYLHHEAKVFNIGVYFEANGHGTVLFKPALLQRLQDMDEQVCWGCAVLGSIGGWLGWWVDGRQLVVRVATAKGCWSRCL
jgi:hypothetical protein